MNAQTVNMFWHGPRMGAVHAACLRSFLRQGHPVVLHCYQAPEDVPAGVTLFDASRIMPFDDLIPNTRTGSVSLGTNRYRYRMIQAGMGLYADCDVYCLRPIPDADYIFGREDDRAFNGAVLKYPPDSALSRRLIADTDTEFFIPPAQPPRDRLRQLVKRALGRGVSVRDRPWGVWGPKLLTRRISELGLEGHARPIDCFYPLHYFNTGLLFEPGLQVEDLITPRSLAIHLCHKMHDRREAPPGSPLHEIITAA